MNTFVIFLIVSIAMLGRVSSFKRLGRPSQLTRVLRMSGGASEGEMAPFYSLGVNVARQVGSELKTILSKEEIDAMLEGFSDSMTNKVEDETALLTANGPKLNEILSGRAAQAVEAEKAKGKDFAASFLLSHPKAQQTASGLIYDEILSGVGPKPTAASTVEVHYHGTLTDGTVFDSSVQRGEPIKFPLSGVIPGWQEGVAMMSEGTKATLVCPSTIAYGDNGSPPVIPPGATLVFEVTLLKVVS